MIQPDYSQFLEKSSRGNLIPVTKEIFADFDTPLSAYCKFKRGQRAFLLESVEGGEILGRFSFIGTEPRIVVRTKGRNAVIEENGIESRRVLAEGEDPLTLLQEIPLYLL